MNKSKKLRILNINTAPDSPAEKAFRRHTREAEINGLSPEAIVPGIAPTPEHDLIFHGGKTIPNLSYINFYVGGKESWEQDDIDNINKALEAAMTDEHLNNVMSQYFKNQQISNTFNSSKLLQGAAPATVARSDVEMLVSKLYKQGMLQGIDLSSIVCNFMLPKGTILTADDASESRRVETQPEHSGYHPIADTDDASDSRHGLGGYHGSIHITDTNHRQVTVYYAVGVYSEVRANGWRNGIPVFDRPWKNVVATFYHELQEARTDPDVEEANNRGDDSLVGWVSRFGEECGDFPVFEAKPLTRVFKEVPLANGRGTVPVQLQYSNAVHGPEGPIQSSHANRELVTH